MELLTGVSHNLNSEDFNWKSAIQNKKLSNVTMNYDSRFVIKKQLNLFSQSWFIISPASLFILKKHHTKLYSKNIFYYSYYYYYYYYWMHIPY